MITFNFFCIWVEEWAYRNSFWSNTLHFLQALSLDCWLKGETAALFQKIRAIPFFNLLSLRNSFWLFFFFLFAFTPNVLFSLSRLAWLAPFNWESECIMLVIFWSWRVYFRFFFWIPTVLIKHGSIVLFWIYLLTIDCAFRFIMLFWNFTLLFK